MTLLSIFAQSETKKGHTHTHRMNIRRLFFLQNLLRGADVVFFFFLRGQLNGPIQIFFSQGTTEDSEVFTNPTEVIGFWYGSRAMDSAGDMAEIQSDGP